MADTDHKMTWDGLFGRTYLVKCSCGWMGNTFADTPETSIDSTWRKHLEPDLGGLTSDR